MLQRVLVTLGLVFCAELVQAQSPPLTPPQGSEVRVYFSPGGNALAGIAKAIISAKQRVWLAGYYFSAPEDAQALSWAMDRQIDVRVVLDATQDKDAYSGARYLFNHGVPTYINRRYSIMHHKFLVIDGDTVGFGSLNFTKSALTRNAENFNIFTRWPELTDVYANEFLRLAQESEPYRSK